MQCIDAVEGFAKSVITSLYQLFLNGFHDDTEYIRGVKAVINGATQFVQTNPEVVSDAQLLTEHLYGFSKNIWLNTLLATPTEHPEDKPSVNDDGYFDYYFDYVFSHDLYPQ
jgi:hypothetical protein